MFRELVNISNKIYFIVEHCTLDAHIHFIDTNSGMGSGRDEVVQIKFLLSR